MADDKVTYQTLESILWDTTKPEQEVSRLYNQKYAEWRKDLARKLDATINQCNMTNQSVVKEVDNDITTSLLAHSRDINDPYPFRLSLVSSTKLCYRAFHMSLHEFLTGERPTICLPNNLRAVVRALTDPAKEERYLSLYGRLKKAQSTKPRDIWEDAPFILSARLNELCGDRLCDFHAIMNFKTDKQRVKPYIRQALSLAENDVTGRSINLKIALYLAIRSKVPIDYFSAPDYTLYANIVYQEVLGDDSAPQVPVEDNLVLYALSALLRMNQADREEEIAKILALD